MYRFSSRNLRNPAVDALKSRGWQGMLAVGMSATLAPRSVFVPERAKSDLQIAGYYNCPL
jgi:hypothetical protein